jgi:thiamine transport system permease protein
MRSKPNWFWAIPLVFIAVLFYWPLTKIIGLGLSANWVEIYFESSTLKAIWFTVWQAAVSTLLALLIGIPGAYVLYRKKFFAQRFIRALITVPLVLPTIVVAIVFSGFGGIPAIP